MRETNNPQQKTPFYVQQFQEKKRDKKPQRIVLNKQKAHSNTSFTALYRGLQTHVFIYQSLISSTLQVPLNSHKS